MDQTVSEILEIAAQVRSHLELQLTLGVTVIETGSIPSAVAGGVSPPRPAAEKTKAPVAKEHEPAKASKPAAARPSSAPTSALEGLREEALACTRCRLAKNRKQVVFGEGNAKASLVFIGHGPGAEEDRQGRPFVDAAGKLLTDIIVKGMKLKREDVYICTLLKCRLPEEGPVEAELTEACEQMLVRQLEAIKPRIIVTLGNEASQGLLRTKEPVENLRGRWQQYHGVQLMPTYDPDHLLRNPDDKKSVWADIQLVMAELEKTQKG